jgi:hypothetical protein
MTELKKYNNIYFSCVDCNWEGNISECDFDTEYDEFKGIDKKYPICPNCDGGLDTINIFEI